MGEVYKATDTRLNRTVAVKILSDRITVDTELHTRFEREARAVALLDHPHICAVYDVGQQDDVSYMVMQYLEGETLAARLARTNGPLPLAQVLTIGGQLADALEKTHRAGLTHRDLKPANVMMTKSGPRLLDFGLAKTQGHDRAHFVVGNDATGHAAAPDSRRHRPWDRALHGARTGRGPGGRCSHGCLGPRSAVVRDGHRATPIRREFGRFRHRRHPQGCSAAGLDSRAADTSRAGSRSRTMSGEGP